MNVDNKFSFYEQGTENKLVGFSVENGKLGLSMSVVPDPMSPNTTFEVMFFETSTNKSVGGTKYGSRELGKGTDPSDQEFWEEIAQRYGNRFKDLESLGGKSLIEAVFPDLEEVKREKTKRI